MKSEMTRYSKKPNKSNRKNTLVTIQDGNRLYFGIARCNVKAGDTFEKTRGRTIARARALRVKEVFSGLDNNSFLSLNGLSGYFEVSAVPELLTYFEKIDELSVKF